MDALVRGLCRTLLFLVSTVVTAALAAPESCLAGHPSTCHAWLCPFVDSATLCAWHRTWYGPNVLATPLTPYYIPRKSAGCGYNYCWCGRGGEMVGQSYVTEWPEVREECENYGCLAGMTLESQGMERLGQIPNDVEFSAAGPSTNRSGR